MTRRARRWWHGVEAEAADGNGNGNGAGTREPWADRAPGPAVLTPAQRAVLAGFDDQPPAPHIQADDGDDQPAVPHLRRDDTPGNGTGNAPGDPEGARPYRRTRWMRQEER